MTTEEIKLNPMRPHAIIVEDEMALSEIYSKALEQAGYYVEAFRNGQDALVHLKKVSPRLLLLDLNLPGASGNEILDSIKKKKAFKDTKIFLISANPQLSLEFEGKVDLILEKPVGYSVLSRLAEKYKPIRKVPAVTQFEAAIFGHALV